MSEGDWLFCLRWRMAMSCLRNVVCSFSLFFPALDITVTPRQRFVKEARNMTNRLTLVLTTRTYSVCVARLTLCILG